MRVMKAFAVAGATVIAYAILTAVLLAAATAFALVLTDLVGWAQ